MNFLVFLKFSSRGSFPYLLLVLAFLISCVGFMMLYSAAGQSFQPWALRQFVRFLVGVGFLVLIARIDIRFWLGQSFFLYIVCFLLLLFVEILGFVGMGARRWVDLYIFQIQPSELMKIVLVLALAAYFHQLGEIKPTLRHLSIPALLIFLPAFLVLRQPDLGTAVILLLTGASVLLAGGVSLWVFSSIGGALMAALPFLWSQLKVYQKKRILIFLNPDQDPLGAGYHILQSKIAIGSGGVYGKGFARGTQSHLNFLPEKQTDFIFTMLCEEWGMIGALGLIALYSLLILKCYLMALEAKYIFNRLLCLGVASILFLHVFINMAMVIGILPVVGVPLPLMSYGGTSMLTVMIGLGLVAGAYGQSEVRLTNRF